MSGGIDPDDMADGDYVYEIFYDAGDDDLIGEPPEPVRFTLTVGDINEQPTDVTITTQTGYVHENDAANNAASDENTDTSGGLFLARLGFEEDDTDTRYTQNELSVPDDDDHFEIRNGDELWLKAGVELDHEKMTDYLLSLQLKMTWPSWAAPPHETFTLYIADVDEQPTEFSVADSTEVAENRRGEDAIKLADIIMRDQDRESGKRDNQVVITSVTDQDDKAVENFSDLFELRAGDTELWLKDPSKIDFETAQRYKFTLTLTADGATDGSAPDPITFTLQIADSVLNADLVETVSLAKLQRDGFNVVITDPGDKKLQAGSFLTTDGRQMKTV